MASITAERETEVVKTAEDIVAKAAASESKAEVGGISAEHTQPRAWDAKAQID